MGRAHQKCRIVKKAALRRPVISGQKSVIRKIRRDAAFL
jgi:hypothetical protein